MPNCHKDRTLGDQGPTCNVHLLLPRQGLYQYKITGNSRNDIASKVKTRVQNFEQKNNDKNFDVSAAILFENAELSKTRSESTYDFYYDLNPSFKEHFKEPQKVLDALRTVEGASKDPISLQYVTTHLQEAAAKAATDYGLYAILAALVLALMFVAASDDPSVYMPDWLHEMRSTTSPLKQGHYLLKWWLDEQEKGGAPYQGPRNTQKQAQRSLQRSPRKSPQKSPQKSTRMTLSPRKKPLRTSFNPREKRLDPGTFQKRPNQAAHNKKDLL